MIPCRILAWLLCASIVMPVVPAWGQVAETESARPPDSSSMSRRKIGSSQRASTEERLVRVRIASRPGPLRKVAEQHEDIRTGGRHERWRVQTLVQPIETVERLQRYVRPVAIHTDLWETLTTTTTYVASTVRIPLTETRRVTGTRIESKPVTVPITRMVDKPQIVERKEPIYAWRWREVSVPQKGPMIARHPYREQVVEKRQVWESVLVGHKDNVPGGYDLQIEYPGEGFKSRGYATLQREGAGWRIAISPNAERAKGALSGYSDRFDVSASSPESISGVWWQIFPKPPKTHGRHNCTVCYWLGTGTCNEFKKYRAWPSMLGNASTFTLSETEGKLVWISSMRWADYQLDALGINVDLFNQGADRTIRLVKEGPAQAPLYERRQVTREEIKDVVKEIELPKEGLIPAVKDATSSGELWAHYHCAHISCDLQPAKPRSWREYLENWVFQQAPLVSSVKPHGHQQWTLHRTDLIPTASRTQLPPRRYRVAERYIKDYVVTKETVIRKVPVTDQVPIMAVKEWKYPLVAARRPQRGSSTRAAYTHSHRDRQYRCDGKHLVSVDGAGNASHSRVPVWQPVLSQVEVPYETEEDVVVGWRTETQWVPKTTSERRVEKQESVRPGPWMSQGEIDRVLKKEERRSTRRTLIWAKAIAAPSSEAVGSGRQLVVSIGDYGSGESLTLASSDRRRLLAANRTTASKPLARHVLRARHKGFLATYSGGRWALYEGDELVAEGTESLVPGVPRAVHRRGGRLFVLTARKDELTLKVVTARAKGDD